MAQHIFNCGPYLVRAGFDPPIAGYFMDVYVHDNDDDPEATWWGYLPPLAEEATRRFGITFPPGFIEAALRRDLGNAVFDDYPTQPLKEVSPCN